MSHPLIQSLVETTAKLEKASAADKEALVTKASTLVTSMTDDLAEMCDIACSFLDHSLPALRAQMEAADKRTEKAADSILSSCEQMMPLLKDCPADTQAQLQAHINSIFEASHFQDLVSQHINEIRRVVDALGEDLSAVREGLHALEKGDTRAPRPKRVEREDAHLLNGPSTIVE